MNECISAMSTTPAINSSAVQTTPVANLSLVLTTPVINLCHGFLVIGDVVDTGNIFITGLIDTGDKSRLSMTLVLTFFPQVVDTGHK